MRHAICAAPTGSFSSRAARHPSSNSSGAGRIGLQEIGHALVGIGRVMLRQLQIGELHHGFGVARVDLEGAQEQRHGLGVALGAPQAHTGVGIGRPWRAVQRISRRFLEAAHAFVGAPHIAQEHRVIVELLRIAGRQFQRECGIPSQPACHRQAGGTEARACRGWPDPWATAWPPSRVFPSPPADCPAAGRPRPARGWRRRRRPAISPIRVSPVVTQAPSSKSGASAAMACAAPHARTLAPSRAVVRSCTRPTSCPQAASMSSPRVRRTVAITPFLSSWSRKRQIASSLERR